ncbi:hypothetical protein AMECASPLE_035681 [Ameca splendens]|uniref:Uncharacterized protein n=1 Tax=Ameca splendens TaxID=208324 RepID=A0ABV0YJN3_9TELE
MLAAWSSMSTPSLKAGTYCHGVCVRACVCMRACVCVCQCEFLLSLRFAGGGRGALLTAAHLQTAEAFIRSCWMSILYLMVHINGKKADYLLDSFCRFSDDFEHTGQAILQPSSAAPGRSKLPAHSLRRTFGLTKPDTFQPRFPNKAHHPDRDPASELVLQARTKTRLSLPVPQSFKH